MRWRKLGRVFCPAGDVEWMRSHAANPVADPLDDRIVRIFFSPRDAKNRSSIAWLELDMREPTRVVRVCEDPVLRPGEPGAFDDSGCSVGCVIRNGSERLLYYLGWNLGVTVPWRNAIGLAVSVDGGEHFVRTSPAPIVDRSVSSTPGRGKSTARAPITGTCPTSTSSVPVRSASMRCSASMTSPKRTARPSSYPHRTSSKTCRPMPSSAPPSSVSLRRPDRSCCWMR